MARRLAPTLADYMAIAISPVLIMGLVGSLAFFLLDLTYHGEHADRLQWILLWFVMAIVLIARIAIVEGGERASIFGLALAGVMMAAVMRFAPSFLLLAPILVALIWWCAHELTWNCTWIDDDEDPGGEGLLQAAGLDRPEESGSSSSKRLENEAALPQPSKRPWWRRMSSRKRRRARAPGVTIVWFSLAALPIFGLGQLAIPVGDLGRRQHAFWLATIYVGCGLGLLLNTAFLGLRRYLRRRGLEMPPSISGGWVTLGALMIGALLIAGALLPRPSAEYSLARAAVEASKEALGANRWAPVSGSAGEGEGASGGEGEQEPQQQGDAEGSGEPGGSQEGDGESGSGEKQGSRGQSADKGGQGKSSSQGKASGKQQSGSGKQAEGQKGQQGQQSEGKGKGQDSGQQQGKQQSQESGQQGNDQGDNNQGEQRGDDPNSKGDLVQDNRENQGKNEASKGKSGERRSSGGSGSPSQKAEGKQAEPSSAAKPPRQPSTTQPLQDFAQQANNLLGSLSGVAKLLKWLLVIAAVGFFVWQFGPELRRMLESVLAWLRGLFEGGAAEDGEEREILEEAVLRKLSFAQFSDPFLSGLSDRAGPDQLVAYTFAALEAWGREAGLERTGDQTPLEFSGALAAKFPQLEPEATQTAEFYTFLAYGRGRLTPEVRGPLESLWQSLRSEAMARQAGQGRVVQI